MPIVRRLLVVLAFLALAPAVDASERGTRDEAMQMVWRAQELFEREGPEATFKAVSGRVPAFYDRDLYVFITDLNGICVAHGERPALIGKNLISLKDHEGKFLVREMIAMARSPGSGWIDYKWPDPLTKKMEDKSSYIERMGDYLVGVGVYTR